MRRTALALMPLARATERELLAGLSVEEEAALRRLLAQLRDDGFDVLEASRASETLP